MRTIKIQEVKRKDDVMVATVAVMEGETELFGRPLTARSKQELDGTIANLYREVNKIDEEIAKVEIGTWTPPTPEPTPEPVPPTAEELKAKEISAKEMELQEEIERAKREREVAELAQADAGVASKLAELEALKTRK